VERRICANNTNHIETRAIAALGHGHADCTCFAPEITTTTLLGGTAGTSYSVTLAATGNTPMTWAITAGSLPGGMTLSSTGTISGMPTAAGTFTFTVTATNASGTDSTVLTIIIAAGAPGGGGPVGGDPGGGAPGGGAPGGGAPGDGANNGGANANGEIDIEDEEVPLAEVISFAPFIEGYPDKTFRGTNSTSREEFVTILFRLLNPNDLPEANPDDTSFNDVASNRWSFDAIEWAKSAGIIDVDEDGNFKPAEMLTRAEMAVMLVRANKWSEMAENKFSDLDDHPDLDYILMAVEAGIFVGYPDGTFKPDEKVNRYEMVTALIRYLLGGEPTEEMIEGIEVSITDVPSDHWAYRYFVLATVGHTALPI
jgi:hypothetical protein